MATQQARRTGNKVILIVVLGIVAIGVVVGIVATRGPGTPPARPGSAVVYDRIASLTDCGQLQREFDTASTNRDRDVSRSSDLAAVDLSYMQAAQDRLKAVGCP